MDIHADGNVSNLMGSFVLKWTHINYFSCAWRTAIGPRTNLKWYENSASAKLLYSKHTQDVPHSDSDAAQRINSFSHDLLPIKGQMRLILSGVFIWRQNEHDDDATTIKTIVNVCANFYLFLCRTNFMASKQWCYCVSRLSQCCGETTTVMIISYKNHK